MINEKSKFERVDIAGYISFNFNDTLKQYMRILGRKTKGYMQMT